MNISFRPITDDDMPFLSRLYASTREDELAATPWSADEKAAFLQMQFMAQHTHYHEHYPDASYDLILADGEPIGRLYIDRWEDEIRLMDIALLPEHRNKGLGTRLMNDILDEARQKKLPVRIHVEKFNPALRLYQRLGFYELEDKGVYLFMEWSPDRNPQSS
ncbi:MAG: N-acetyltransferase [Chloroflexi bacterium]|nr:MAG: N-acetyltransferase [Chloroflexota bacterium]